MWSTPWIVVAVFCALVVIALIVVVVLGATGTIFKSSSTTTSVSINRDAIPDHSQEWNREKPVLDHVQRNSVFEPIKSPSSKDITIDMIGETPVHPSTMYSVNDSKNSVSTMKNFATPDELQERVVMTAKNELTFIEYVVYVGLDGPCPELEQEINQLPLSLSVVRERLVAIKHTAHQDLLATIACLSKAQNLNKNLLLLHKGCQLTNMISKNVPDRWDVVTTENGMLINKSYLPTMIAHLVEQLKNKIDRIDLTELQQRDAWMPFTQPDTSAPST